MSPSPNTMSLLVYGASVIRAGTPLARECAPHLDPADLVYLLSEVGAHSVNCRDSDLIPIDASTKKYAKDCLHTYLILKEKG